MPDLSPAAPLFLGIEIGGTKLQLGLGRGDGALLDLERLRADSDFAYRFLQPMDGPAQAENIALCIDTCLRHPSWRLSLQTHKLTGIR